MVEYGYAVGRIRSMEALMLSREHLTRMADARDFESAFLVLNETCYADKIDKLSRPFDFTELLELESHFVKRFLAGMAPDSEIMTALLNDRSAGSEEAYLQGIAKAAQDSDSPLFKKYAAALADHDPGSEKKQENRLMEIVKMAKYQAFGVEPLIGFFFGKEIEIKNIRLVLTGKLLKAETEDIKERMRHSYV